jgi:hypothetical protein
MKIAVAYQWQFQKFQKGGRAHSRKGGIAKKIN